MNFNIDELDVRRLLFDPVLSFRIYLQRLAIFVSIVLFILLISLRSYSRSNEGSAEWGQYIGDAYTYRRELVSEDIWGLIILIGVLLAAYNWSYVLNITQNNIHTWNTLTNQKHNYECINNNDAHSSAHVFFILFLFVFIGKWSVDAGSVGFLMPISDLDHLRTYSVSYVASVSWAFWEGDETFKIIKFPIACFGYLSFFKLSSKLADISNSRESSTDQHMPFSLAGLWGCCDRRGNLTVRPRYEGVEPFNKKGSPYGQPIGIKAKGKWGYVLPFDSDYSRIHNFSIIEPKYDWVGGFIDDLAEVSSNDRRGFVDRNKKEYWSMNEKEARQNMNKYRSMNEKEDE